MIDSTKQMMKDAPLCMMLPLADEDPAPPGFENLDGREFDPKERKEFFEILKQRLENRLISKWWYNFGGNRTSRLPNIPSKEVYRACPEIPPQDRELKLVIKTHHV